MDRFGRRIVALRIPILIAALVLLVPSVIGYAKTRVNYDILSYLPGDIETMAGQDILTEEFGTGAFSMFVAEGMTPKEITELKNEIEQVEHVKKVIWYDTAMDISVPMEMLPDELYEAGQLDGCTPFKYLLRVVVPLSKPILAVLVLYYGVTKWNSYFDAMIYLKSQTMVPLQIVLRDILILNQVDYTMISDASAIAAQRGLTDLLKYSTIVVASLPVLCIYPFVQKYFVKGVMIGAVKG